MKSPFKLTLKRTFGAPSAWRASTPIARRFQVSEEEVEFSAIDLATGESTPLLSLPDGSGLISPPAWTPDGSQAGARAYEHPQDQPQRHRAGREDHPGYAWQPGACRQPVPSK